MIIMRLEIGAASTEYFDGVLATLVALRSTPVSRCVGRGFGLTYLRGSMTKNSRPLYR